LRFVIVKPGKEKSADTGVVLKLNASKASAAKYVVPLITAVREYVSVMGSVRQPRIFVFKYVKVNTVAVRMSVISSYIVSKSLWLTKSIGYYRKFDWSIGTLTVNETQEWENKKRIHHIFRGSEVVPFRVMKTSLY